MGVSQYSKKINLEPTPEPKFYDRIFQAFKTVWTFLFPDDTKLKIECTTDFNYNAEANKLTLHRKFYTLRSLLTFLGDVYFKMPAQKSWKIIQERPVLAFSYAALFALVFIKTLRETSFGSLAFVAGSIAFDATAATTGSATNTITINHTCTGSNRVLTAGAMLFRSGPSATYNSVAMTVSALESTSVFNAIFTLVAPATGTNACVISMSGGSSNMAGCCISFTGADQNNPIGNTKTNSAAANTTCTTSLNIHSANSITVESQYKQNGTAMTQNSSQTERSDQVSSDGHATATLQHTSAGATSLSFSGNGGNALLTHSIVEVRELGRLGVDAISSKKEAGVTSSTLSHTCSGTDRILVVTAFSNRTISGITYNGVAMTLQDQDTHFGQYTVVYSMVAPPTGANNIVVSISGGSGSILIAAISFINASGLGAHTNNFTSGNTLSTNITLQANGSFTVESQEVNNSTSITENSSQVQIASQNDAGTGQIAGAWKQHASSGSVALSFSGDGGTESMANAIVEVKEGAQLTTQVKTITAKARILTAGVAKTIQAKARIKVLDNPKTVTARARIKQAGIAKTITAKAYILGTATLTIQARARIFQSGFPQTIRAKARVKVVDIPKTVMARARVLVMQTKTIQAKALIHSPLAGFVDMRSYDQSYQKNLADNNYFRTKRVEYPLPLEDDRIIL